MTWDFSDMRDSWGSGRAHELLQVNQGVVDRAGIWARDHLFKDSILHTPCSSWSGFDQKGKCSSNTVTLNSCPFAWCLPHARLQNTKVSSTEGLVQQLLQDPRHGLCPGTLGAQGRWQGCWAGGALLIMLRAGDSLPSVMFLMSCTLRQMTQPHLQISGSWRLFLC